MLDLNSLSFGGLLTWMVIVAAVAVGLPFVLADRLDVPRWVYVVALAAVTGALWLAVSVWQGDGLRSAVGWHWASGLLVAPVAGALPALGITRMPASRPRHGVGLVAALGWDAAVYGAAEGLLLSALPAYLAWHAVRVATGDGAALASVAASVAAVAFSLLVIVVHHLGYPEFRHPRGLVMASVACGLLTIGYLVTGSVWTPIVGHVLMHSAAIIKGNALPPHSDAGTEPPRTRAARPTSVRTAG